jgi:hypothetical protein
MFEALTESFLLSLDSLWVKVLGFAPAFVGALIVLIVGLIIASMLGRFAKKIVQMTKIDNISESIGLKQEIEKMGVKLNFSILIGWVVKWFFFIATFIAVVDILNITQLTLFLEKLVLYLPNVIVAIIILAVGLIVGKIVNNGARNALRSSSVTESISAFLGSLAKWAIFIFAFMAALVQLGIAASLIQILFTGFVLMLSVAGGLAFGLGCRAHASKVLDWVEREITHNKN